MESKKTATNKAIHICIVETDPLRLIGLRALLESESDFAVIAAAPQDILTQPDVTVVLLGDRPGSNLVGRISNLRAMRHDLPIIVIGSNTGDEAIIRAIASGAKGYVFDGAEPGEFAQAIRTVHRGSIWASRRILSTVIERASTQRKGNMSGGVGPLTPREKEVLKMLVAGLSNREIGTPLGIEERTVKAHIAKMMRKVGVQNRIALSVHAITHSLVRRQPSPSGNAGTQ
jgi:DNA-binding NarL/FixJ family response regulator